MVKITISNEAYVKAFLHGAKNSSNVVGGFLLGTSSTSVSDCFPVYHDTPLGPLLDNALLVANEIWTKKDLQIVGFYYAVATINNDHNIPSYISEIESSLLNITKKDILMLQILNNDIDNNNKLCMKGSIISSGSSSSSSGSTSSSSCDVTVTLMNNDSHSIKEINLLINKLLAEGIHRRIEDFEDHMDVASKDFRNEFIREML